MGGRCSRRRFLAAVMGISPKEARSKSLRRKEPIIRACTGKSSMRAETQSWRMPMQTCRFHPEENLSLRRCIISCGLMQLTECMPDICPAIPRRMDVSGCRNSMQLRFSIRLASALRSLWSVALQLVATTQTNHNPLFCGVRASARPSVRDLRRLRRLGGGKIARSPLALVCAVLSAPSSRVEPAWGSHPLRQRTLQHVPKWLFKSERRCCDR
jgi:hypothetical protein